MSEDLKNLIQKISKKYKYDSGLYKASEIPDVTRIPTEILMPDICTGGGIPIGRISLMFGKKGSGKTYMCLKVIARAQKTCRVCYQEKENCLCKEFLPFRVLYIDVEQTWHKKWAKKVGVDLEKLYIFRPVYAEEMIDYVKDIIREDGADLIVVDSIAALNSIAENDRSSAEWTQGLLARLSGKLVRYWVSAMQNSFKSHQRVPTILLINQVRQKIGQYVPTESVPGGLAIGFATSLELKLWSDKPQMNKTTGKPEWVNLGFDVVKNKLSTPFLSGSFRLIVADDVMPHKKSGDVFEEEDALGLALKGGIIINKGKEYTWRDKKFRLQEEIVDFWLQNPNEFKLAKKDILEHYLKSDE